MKTENGNLPSCPLPKDANKPKIFGGWWVVISSAICLFVVYGFTYFPLYVTFKDIQAEFGLSRGSLSGVIALFGIITSVGYLLTGRLCDRFGALRIMRWTALLIGVGVVSVGFTRNLGQLYAAYTVISVGVSGLSIVSANVLVASWFGNKRGKAVGCLSVGVSLGGFGGSLASGFLLVSFGWRATFIILGLAAVALIWPLLIWVIREAPPALRLSQGISSTPSVYSQGAQASSFTPSLTLRQALNTPTFWLLAVGLLLVSTVWVGVLSHSANYLRDRGISPSNAAIGQALISAMGLWVKPLSGYLSDRLSQVGLFVAFILLQASGVFLLTQVSAEPSAYVALVVLGIGAGGAVPLRPLLTSQFFGSSRFGSLYGAMEMAYGFGSTIGPVIAGSVFDLTGSYHTAFVIFLVAYGLAAACVIAAYFLHRKKAT